MQGVSKTTTSTTVNILRKRKREENQVTFDNNKNEEFNTGKTLQEKEARCSEAYKSYTRMTYYKKKLNSNPNVMSELTETDLKPMMDASLNTESEIVKESEIRQLVIELYKKFSATLERKLILDTTKRVRQSNKSDQRTDVSDTAKVIDETYQAGIEAFDYETDEDEDTDNITFVDIPTNDHNKQVSKHELIKLANKAADTTTTSNNNSERLQSKLDLIGSKENLKQPLIDITSLFNS
jgi:hypothetical protein